MYHHQYTHPSFHLSMHSCGRTFTSHIEVLQAVYIFWFGSFKAQIFPDLNIHVKKTMEEGVWNRIFVVQICTCISKSSCQSLIQASALPTDRAKRIAVGVLLPGAYYATPLALLLAQELGDARCCGVVHGVCRVQVVEPKVLVHCVRAAGVFCSPGRGTARVEVSAEL